MTTVKDDKAVRSNGIQVDIYPDKMEVGIFYSALLDTEELLYCKNSDGTISIYQEEASK